MKGKSYEPASIAPMDLLLCIARLRERRDRCAAGR